MLFREVTGVLSEAILHSHDEEPEVLVLDHLLNQQSGMPESRFRTHRRMARDHAVPRGRLKAVADLSLRIAG